MPPQSDAPFERIDSRKIRIGQRTVATTFPIDHLIAVGNRLVLAIERHENYWIYQGFPLDLEANKKRGVNHVFLATVLVGTHISLPACDERGLVLPGGVEATLPGDVRSVVESTDGFLVLVDPMDVGVDNAFFVERGGIIRWQVEVNPFSPGRSAGGYNGVERDKDGRLYVSLDPYGFFEVDTRDGSIVQRQRSLS